MKTQIKKHLALFVALVMCLGVLAGCEQTPAETTAPATKPVETTAPNQTTAPVETTEPAELMNSDIYPLDSDKVFTVATGRANAGEIAATQRWAEITGVEIEWITWEDEQAKMALTSKELPDAVFWLAASAVDKATAYEYGSAGYFINYMDYLDYMPNFKALIEAEPDVLTFVQNPDGSVYSLPRVGKTSTDYGNLLYFRTDMMEAIGWDEPPRTTDEFLRYIKELQTHYGADDPEFQAFNAYNNKYMGWNYSSGVLPFFFFPSFGDQVYAGLNTVDGKTVQLGLATEQYKRLLVFMNEVYESGAFGKDIYTEDGTVSRALTVANKVGITPFASYLTKYNFESGELELTLLAPLTSEYNSEQVYYTTSRYLWRGCMISSKCEDIETMCRWMDSFYATEENPLNKEGTIWGISSWIGELGVDYTVDKENNTYTVLPHEGYDTASAWFSNESFGSALGQMNFLYVDMSGTGLQKKAEGTVNILLPCAKYNFDMSMLSLTEDETIIYSDAWTDINTYVTEQTAKFISGEIDIEAGWDEYIKNLEAMGLQDVLDVYQAAYDRYLAG